MNDQMGPVKAIVMGASWGGLNAYTQVLSALPARFPAAILLVQHQHASAENRLPWLLARYCELPVIAPEDKEEILPGHVYVAPPGYHMLVNEDETLAFSVGRPVHFSRPAVDELFFSAGAVYGRHLAAVILTGANEDGAAGIEYIHQRGGYTIAQSLVSAEAPAMPDAAIKTGAVSRVLDLEAIGPFLAEKVAG
ncbi:protein-glutamate methylesterase [Alcanivorax sp. MD8A]|uniref:chemotaxis protein CheB n=1 Tax=Alcanivorax sp. MD8A TaxID=1177157 RepID=UPI000CB47862|nr:chemotaxis protein CheB [Alcanivorax sp. MD8A]MEE2869510.1 chemotaxis protein CheB [Pseudomonadota bacterium]PNE01944.1 protein-glutamate methylesterase [Alcanivorax sp. MD8A]